MAAAGRLAYCVPKVSALVLAGSATVLAAVGAPAALTATLAAGVVVLEGVQNHAAGRVPVRSRRHLTTDGTGDDAAVTPTPDPGPTRRATGAHG